MAMDFGKLNFSTSFKPTSAFPLNANCYFESFAEATAAAQTAEETGSSNTVYHFGQEIVVVENNVATLYLIQPDKTLKEVGTVPVGDGKTISVIDNKIQMYGAKDAETGAQPVMQADGTIAWVVPSTSTVEGLQTAVANLQENKADKTSVYTKEEVDSKLSSVYKFSGSVNSYADLPTNLTEADAGKTYNVATADKTAVYTKEEVDAKVSSVYKYCGSVNAYADLPTDLQDQDSDIGKVYNVRTADKTHKIKAGDNVAWTGTDWDILSGEVDLTEYYTKTEANDKFVAKVEGSRLITETEAEQFAKAEPNVVKSVDAAEFKLDESGKLTVLQIAMSKIAGLSDLKANVDTLIGTDTSKSVRTIAQEEVAKVPNASNTAFGLMKGSDDVEVENGVIKSVSTDVLVQGVNQLVLDGGVFND